MDSKLGSNEEESLVITNDQTTNAVIDKDAKTPNSEFRYIEAFKQIIDVLKIRPFTPTAPKLTSQALNINDSFISRVAQKFNNLRAHKKIYDDRTTLSENYKPSSTMHVPASIVHVLGSKAGTNVVLARTVNGIFTHKVKALELEKTAVDKSLESRKQAHLINQQMRRKAKAWARDMIKEPKFKFGATFNGFSLLSLEQLADALLLYLQDATIIWLLTHNFNVMLPHIPALKAMFGAAGPLKTVKVLGKDMNIGELEALLIEDGKGLVSSQNPQEFERLKANLKQMNEYLLQQAYVLDTIETIKPLLGVFTASQDIVVGEPAAHMVSHNISIAVDLIKTSILGDSVKLPEFEVRPDQYDANKVKLQFGGVSLTWINDTAREMGSDSDLHLGLNADLLALTAKLINRTEDFILSWESNYNYWHEFLNLDGVMSNKHFTSLAKLKDPLQSPVYGAMKPLEGWLKPSDWKFNRTEWLYRTTFVSATCVKDSALAGKDNFMVISPLITSIYMKKDILDKAMTVNMLKFYSKSKWAAIYPGVSELLHVADPFSSAITGDHNNNAIDTGIFFDKFDAKMWQASSRLFGVLEPVYSYHANVKGLFNKHAAITDAHDAATPILMDLWTQNSKIADRADPEALDLILDVGYSYKKADLTKFGRKAGIIVITEMLKSTEIDGYPGSGLSLYGSQTYPNLERMGYLHNVFNDYIGGAGQDDTNPFGGYNPHEVYDWFAYDVSKYCYALALSINSAIKVSEMAQEANPDKFTISETAKNMLINGSIEA